MNEIQIICLLIFSDMVTSNNYLLSGNDTVATNGM